MDIVSSLSTNVHFPSRNQGIKEKVLEKRIATSLLYPTIDTDGSKAMYSAGSDITPWRIADRQCRREEYL